MAVFEQESDEILIQYMHAREEPALLELHRRYAAYLRAMARRMLRDSDWVEQAVQDAFVQAWEAAGRFDPSKASAKTWLITLAHRLMLNRLRDLPPSELPLEDWDAPVESGDALEQLMVRRAVDTLETGERQMVELAFYRGHSHAELAVLTGKPLGTVKAKLRSALLRLKSYLGGVSHDRNSG
jgi:RNA polymerase sigma-70 factor, ECF subfamily